MRQLCIVLAAITGAAIGTQAGAAEPITWRYQTTLVEARMEMEHIRAWAARIAERSGNRLQVKIFYGGSLGINQSDEMRAIRQGSVDVAAPYYGYLARDFPELQHVLPQGVLLKADEALKVSGVVREIFRDTYEKWNGKIIGWQMSPVFDMSVMCRPQVGSLDQLKGKKLRVWSRDQVETFKKLHVAAQIVPQGDTYMALQTGVVDCALYVLGNVKSVSFQEVVSYSAQLHTFSATPNPIVANAKAWQELPDDLKAVVLEAGEVLWKSSMSSAIEESRAKEEDARREFAATGKPKVLEPFSAADKQTFYQAVLEVWKDRANEAGLKAVEIRNKVAAELEAVRK